jgi:hypothetical protein
VKSKNPDSSKRSPKKLIKIEGGVSLMRRLSFLAVFLLLLPLSLLAQDAPKAEFFGGYSYFHADGGANLNGWNASVAGNVNKWFGVVADFAGHYNDFSQHTYMFAPRLTYRENERVTPFVQALFGDSHVSSGGFQMTLLPWPWEEALM